MTLTEFLTGALTGGVITYAAKSVYDNHKREKARANFITMYNAKNAAKSNGANAASTPGQSGDRAGCGQASGSQSANANAADANSMSNLVILSI